MNDTNPLSIILVQDGSKGDKLLFLYPFLKRPSGEPHAIGKRHNHYAVPVRDDLQTARASSSNIENGQLVGFPDQVLSNLFAVKTQLCGKKFELKVNDVRFVGHPTLLETSVSQVATRWQPSSIILFNIVFALRASASHSVVNCYHDLSQRLGAALRHEEQRGSYLSNEAKIMLAVHDEEELKTTPFEHILSQSQLARELKTAYENLCNTGIVNLFINNWVEVSFCLPQRVHSLHNKGLAVEPEALYKCFKALRPYHAVLLLVEEKELWASLAPDSSPALGRLIRVANPLKSLKQLASDADLPLRQVFDLVSHLVYWAKATVIYPLCEANVYVLSPHAPTHITSSLVERFTERFPEVSLLAIMSEFSFPTSLSQNPMHLPQQQVQQVQMVVWMLQHRLLMQLHTYIYLVPAAQGSSLLINSSSIKGRRVKSLQDEGSLSGKVPSDSDAASVTSDEYSPSPVNTKSNGSLMSDEIFSPKHFHDGLPMDLTPLERENIMKVPAASSPEDLRLFIRLCPYFRGCHHLEEIMYSENLRRSQIIALLDKFRSVLITCQHEDTAVSMFYC